MKAADYLITLALAATVLNIALPVGTLMSAPMRMQEQLVGNVIYITGGVGRSEAAVMRNFAKDYLLEVSFIQKQPGQREEFLADVKVQILDEQQNVVLDVTTDGPFLLANLPQGNYLVTAEHHGEAKQQKVNVDANKHQKIEFKWLVSE
ncbi:MAG: carboxypeptidase-like regulatory domain-containing protein [Methylotenera sp.]